VKVAVIGAGIAGNVAARELHREHDVTVFEAGDHVGGHTHTHDVVLHGRTWQVDTGFIVFNDRTYPNFISLLDELGVAAQDSNMSFSVRDEASGLEYNGTSINTLFAQRSNLVRPSFLGMVRDILRFNREAPRLLDAPGGELPLRDFLERGRYGRHFVDHYVVPMGAAIWSTDPASMMRFPARFFVRFLHNHGMLTVNDRPTWRTIKGGSARYVERLVAPFRDRIQLVTPVEQVRRIPGGVLVKPRGHESVRFDAVFLACHSDQALAMLADASDAEREVLGAIAYQANETVLHTDASLLPRRRLAWAAWNYARAADTGREQAAVCLHYLINRLQPLPWQQPVLVSLNPDPARPIAPAQVLGSYDYSHPVFDLAAIRAQQQLPKLQGRSHLWFCGAWARYGFHEDGLSSALDVVQRMRAQWQGQPRLPAAA